MNSWETVRQGHFPIRHSLGGDEKERRRGERSEGEREKSEERERERERVRENDEVKTWRVK